MKKNPEKIIISRTDNLGDVILSLPMATAIKQVFPEVKIIFLGKKYTETIIKKCRSVDEFMDWDAIQKMSPEESLSFFRSLHADIIIHTFPNKEIAKLSFKAKIPLRIGTSHRLFHWMYCNKLIHLSRKNSDLHEAQLNLKLVEPITNKQTYTLNEISSLYNFSNENKTKISLDKKIKLIIHPGTKGSAREWGVENYKNLVDLLSPEKYQLYLSGNEEEGLRFRKHFETYSHIEDVSGKFTMDEFIAFIFSCDGIVAASTGPLHIAAAAGKVAIGLYAPMRPIFPTRWAPLGKNASYLVSEKECSACKKLHTCECIQSIKARDVKTILDNFFEIE